MKKLLAIVLTLVMCLTLFPSVISADNNGITEILTDGSFEGEGLTGLYNSAAISSEICTDADYVRSGNQSLKLKDGVWMLSDYLDVSNDQSYTLSFWTKGYSRMIVYIEYYTDKTVSSEIVGKPWGNTSYGTAMYDDGGSISARNNWELISVSATPDFRAEGAKYIRFGLRVLQPTADTNDTPLYIDDASIQAVPHSYINSDIENALVYNDPFMNKNPNNWWTPNARSAWDTTEYHTAPYSIKMTASDGEAATYTKFMNVNRSTVYEVSAWLKGVTNGAKAQIAVQPGDGTAAKAWLNTRLNSANTATISTTTEWKQYKGLVWLDTDDKTTYTKMRVYICSPKGSTVYVDDVTISPLDIDLEGNIIPDPMMRMKTSEGAIFWYNKSLSAYDYTGGHSGDICQKLGTGSVLGENEYPVTAAAASAFTANTTYEVTFWAKSQNETDKPFDLIVFDKSLVNLNTILRITPKTEWTKYKAYVGPELISKFAEDLEGNGTIRLGFRLLPGFDGGYLWVDDVTMKPVTDFSYTNLAAREVEIAATGTTGSLYDIDGKVYINVADNYTMIAAVYGSDGLLKDCAIVTKDMLPGHNTFDITMTKAVKTVGDTVKVFAFDGMDTISPIKLSTQTTITE